MKVMRKILIVDDEQEIITILEEFLGRKGYDVLTALGGNKAIESINSNIEIDLMVLDLKMPEVGGVEVLKELKNARLKIPVIILSGSIGIGGTIDSLQRLGYGYDDVLNKPVDLYELLDMIKLKLGCEEAR